MNISNLTQLKDKYYGGKKKGRGDQCEAVGHIATSNKVSQIRWFVNKDLEELRELVMQITGERMFQREQPRSMSDQFEKHQGSP